VSTASPLATPASPAAVPYLVDIAHARSSPLVNRFRYRSCSWLVDLDGVDTAGRVDSLPPLLRRLLRFPAADHLGTPGNSWRANVVDFAAGHGIDLSGARIQALTGAKTFGHGFNPITMYWCSSPAGEPLCAIAEVHNTYGQEHAYLLSLDAQHHARVSKVFHVSPFNRVEGEYDVLAPPPGAEVDVRMTLRAPGAKPFVATWRGRRARGRDRATVLVRSAFATQLVSLQIRRQGIALWLRRLPLVPPPSAQPPSHQQEPA
jgi:DUF1365 family protein